MKKLKYILLLSFLIIIPLTHADAWFYNDPDFSNLIIGSVGPGWSGDFSPNDALESISFGNGDAPASNTEVTIYEDSGFGGDWMTLYNSDTDLGDDPGSFSGGYWDNKASSYKVRTRTDPDVILYAGINYKGSNREFNYISGSPCIDVDQGLNKGENNNEFNDKLHSFKILKKDSTYIYQLYLFNNDDCTGTVWGPYETNYSSLPDGDAVHTSAIKITRRERPLSCDEYCKKQGNDGGICNYQELDHWCNGNSCYWSINNPLGAGSIHGTDCTSPSDCSCYKTIDNCGSTVTECNKFCSAQGCGTDTDTGGNYLLNSVDTVGNYYYKNPKTKGTCTVKGNVAGGSGNGCSDCSYSSGGCSSCTDYKYDTNNIIEYFVNITSTNVRCDLYKYNCDNLIGTCSGYKKTTDWDASPNGYCYVTNSFCSSDCNAPCVPASKCGSNHCSADNTTYYYNYGCNYLCDCSYSTQDCTQQDLGECCDAGCDSQQGCTKIKNDAKCTDLSKPQCDQDTCTCREPSNLPPNKPTNPSPSDGEREVDYNSLNVYVTDPDGDTMNVTFYDASDNSTIDTVSNISSGSIASGSWNNLNDSTTYYWYAKACDFWACNTSDTWNFTTNYPPNKPTNPSPSDGAIGSSTSPTLSAHISDPDNDNNMGTFFSVSSGDSCNYMSGISSGSIVTCDLSNLDLGTTYYWNVTAMDSNGETAISDTWSFTTCKSLGSSCSNATECCDNYCNGGNCCDSSASESCNDGIDNDCDGYIDCLDTDCCSSAYCQPSSCDCPDLNNNGIIEFLDLTILTGGWGSSDSTTDLNNDGITDCKDKNCVTNDYNKPTCDVTSCKLDQLGTCSSNNECNSGICNDTNGDHNYICHYSNSGNYQWDLNPLPAEANCTDTHDNDCNGESDYDSSDGRHGDSNCPISVNAIYLPTNCTKEFTSINVECESDVPNVNSIKASLNETLCTYTGWNPTIPNNAQFTCGVASSTTETCGSGNSVEAKCYVDTSKSYQSGINQTDNLWVYPGNCSSYTSESTCEAADCDWCEKCSQDSIYSSKIYATNLNNQSICVDAGTCDDNYYQCKIDSCNATCDNDNGSCSDKDCDYLDGCYGTNLSEYRNYSDVSRTCSTSNCTCNDPLCNSYTPGVDTDGDGYDDNCENYSYDSCSIFHLGDNCGTSVCDQEGEGTYCTNCAFCGDGICECGEDYTSCSADCAQCTISSDCDGTESSCECISNNCIDCSSYYGWGAGAGNCGSTEQPESWSCSSGSCIANCCTLNTKSCTYNSDCCSSNCEDSHCCPSGYYWVASRGDCYSGREGATCDGDGDCDTGLTCYDDDDRDRYDGGAGPGYRECHSASMLGSTGDDCDDGNANINPGVTEDCDDGIDNDCDGLTDGNDPDCGECQSDSDCNNDYYDCDGTYRVFHDVYCDLNDNTCKETTTSTNCNDGLYCNGQETCQSGVCNAGTPINCNDGVSCTEDSCNEDTDSCDNIPNNNLCDDSNSCTEDICTLSGCNYTLFCDNSTCLIGSADYCNSCTHCGDNIINCGEECEGSNLNGQTCESLGYSSGTLSCTPSCSFDRSQCSGGTEPITYKIAFKSPFLNIFKNIF